MTVPKLKLTNYGQIAERELLKIPYHFNCVKVDKYCVMPDHVHAIIMIGCNYNSELFDKTPALSVVIGLYKSGVSKTIHEIDPTIHIWQRSFYDRIIRDEKSYFDIWKYIDENPHKWLGDEH